MDAVVDDVARDDEPDRGNMQARRVRRVGVAALDGDQRVPFEVDRGAVQTLGGPRVGGELAGERALEQLSGSSRLAIRSTVDAVATAFASGTAP